MSQPSNPAEYTPALTDVGSILRLRTGYQGSLLGTFTADTQPTDTEVTAIISSAVAELYGTFGPDVPDALIGNALQVAKLYAAMMVELSFFADQIAVDRSPYTQLQILYQNALNAFVLRRKQISADGVPGSPDDTAGSGMPRAIFPAAQSVESDTAGLTGWERPIW